uniref:Uncharacterized protein n=1 Tax=Aegilops tauschii subsp. strangulata TaxID=200361 RepID=A0A453NBA2_AEGTS
MADPTPPPPPLLALHLSPPTSGAPRQDPANALVVPSAVPPTTLRVPAPSARRKSWSFHCRAAEPTPQAQIETDLDLTASPSTTPAPALPRASPHAHRMETADRLLPARISFLAGPPQRRHLHGRALAPLPPTSASAPPSSSSSAQQPPDPVPSHHRALRRAPATSNKITPLATPPPRLAPGKTRSARRGLSWGHRQHPPPLATGRGRHRRRRQRPGEEIRRLLV